MLANKCPNRPFPCALFLLPSSMDILSKLAAFTILLVGELALSGLAVDPIKIEGKALPVRNTHISNVWNSVRTRGKYTQHISSREFLVVDSYYGVLFESYNTMIYDFTQIALDAKQSRSLTVYKYDSLWIKLYVCDWETFAYFVVRSIYYNHGLNYSYQEAIMLKFCSFTWRTAAPKCSRCILLV